jgi:hypothetical protein
MQQRLLTQTVSSALFVGYFWWCVINYTSWHFIDFINLIFHEAGHVIFIIFPDIITAIMGSGFQLLIPATFVVYFYQKRELLSANLLMLWFAQNFVNVSVYVRDSIPMQLELLGGDSVTHDWNFILGQLGLLGQSAFIANCLLLVCYLIMVFSTAWIFHYFWNNYTAQAGDSGKIGD